MYTFRVEGLNCMSCFHNIEDSLKEFDKNINAKADVRNQILTVESSRPQEELKKVIEDAGYPVKDVTQN